VISGGLEVRSRQMFVIGDDKILKYSLSMSCEFHIFCPLSSMIEQGVLGQRTFLGRLLNKTTFPAGDRQRKYMVCLRRLGYSGTVTIMRGEGASAIG